MKYLIKAMTLIMFAIVLMGCNRTRASWQFVMDKGGLSVGNPYLEKRSYYLPVNCNASGSEEITVKPVIITSYPVYYTYGKAVVVGNNIEIELYYSLKEGGSDLGRIKLPRIKPGQYSVFYRDIMDSKVFIDKVSF